MRYRWLEVAGAALTLCTWGLLAADPSAPEPAPAPRLADVLPDDVLCKGKGVEVRRSQVDRALQQFKANALARGQKLPESRESELENQLLDRLVVTQLLLSQATDTDRTKAKETTAKFVAETRQKAGSEAAFERQLLAMAFTVREFEHQIQERPVCEEVIERELRPQVKITDAQVREYYDQNAQRLQRPEMVRASHILLSTRDPVTGQELSEDKRQEKRRLIGQLLERARKGEDFAALAKEYSEDERSKAKGGEYIFSRGEMVTEFESAAFTLQTNQVSDVVTTRYGYHIIKLSQRIPPEPIEFDKVQDDIRKSLERQEIQDKLLPAHIEKLRAAAQLEYLNGAQPRLRPRADGAEAAPTVPPGQGAP